jgi:hypothetical protein
MKKGFRQAAMLDELPPHVRSAVMNSQGKPVKLLVPQLKQGKRMRHELSPVLGARLVTE